MNRFILVAIALLLVLGIGGYFLYTSNQSMTSTEIESSVEVGDMDRGPVERTVSLFFYDPTRDQDAQGNIMCTDKGLIPVSRTITTITPIEDTVRLLLSGNLTVEERAEGITTEYPLSGVSLTSVTLGEDGELRVALNDPEGRTGGGSCRVAVLAAQIRATALQFPEVRKVTFEPEDLFQP